MKCSNCGSEVKEGVKFCRECGSEIIAKAEVLGENICPNCGNILEQKARFCNACGVQLAESTESFVECVSTCAYCGNSLKEDALFCGVCGNSVHRTQSDNVMRKGEAVKKKDKGMIFLMALLIVVLIGSAVTIGYVYCKNNSINIQTPRSHNEADREREKKEKEVEEPETEIEEETEKENASATFGIDNDMPEEQDELYLFPSDREYITISDLYGRSQEEVALIRNEIYARHGYIFNTEPFKSYFEAKDWYVPNPSFTDSVFNEIEKANKDFIVNYETEKGWR